MLEVDGFFNTPSTFLLLAFGSFVFGLAGWSPIYMNGDSRKKGDCGMSAGVRENMGDNRNVPVLKV